MTREYSHKIILVVAVLITLCSASFVYAGPADPISNGIQLAQIDYVVIHDQLIEQCKSNYPNSVPVLKDAIRRWSDKNSGPLRELRQLSKERLMRNTGLSEIEASNQMTQMSDLLTKGLKTQVASVSGNALKEACEGQYAVTTLESPSLDFTGLLAKIRLTNVKP
jgi:flagellar motor component MotA